MRIVIRNLSKTLGKKEVLKNITCTFRSGKIYGIKGRNGSGKTMLLRAISGLISPTSGEVMINRKVIGKDIDFPESVGLLLEHDNMLLELSLKENLRLLSKLKKIATEEDILAAIERVGLDISNNQPIRKFSLGMKQRAALAQSLFEDPDILLLDEATNGIDEEGVYQVREILLEEKKKGKLIIITSHNQEDLDILADEMIFMKEGEIVHE